MSKFENTPAVATIEEFFNLCGTSRHVYVDNTKVVSMTLSEVKGKGQVLTLELESLVDINAAVHTAPTDYVRLHAGCRFNEDVLYFEDAWRPGGEEEDASEPPYFQWWLVQYVLDDEEELEYSFKLSVRD